MAGKSRFVKVGILPHEHRYEVNLGSVPLDFLDWPGQVAPKSGTIADLTVSDHVVVYPSSKRLMRSFGAINYNYLTGHLVESVVHDNNDGVIPNVIRCLMKR